MQICPLSNILTPKSTEIFCIYLVGSSRIAVIFVPVSIKTIKVCQWLVSSDVKTI